MRLGLGFGRYTNVAALGGGGAPVETIGGVAIGAAGGTGTPYEGLILTAGDDFDSLPSRWSHASKSGVYSSSAPQSGFRRSQGNFSTTTTDAMIYVDPGFRGNRSQLTAPLSYEPLSVSSSVLSITAASAGSDLKDVSPAHYTGGGGDVDNKPDLYSGRLASWPSFMLSVSGDWVFEVKVKFPAGANNIPGWWPSAWLSALLWPDYQEYDLLEGRTSGTNRQFAANINGSLSDGSGNSTQNIVSTMTVTTSRFVTMVVRKEGTTVTQYDDIAVEGTLAQRATYTNARVSRFRGAHEVRLELAINTAWQTYSYNAGDWPQVLQFDWWRVWTPSAAPQNAALQVIDEINTTPGGSWAATFPAASTLYGFTPDFEEVYSAFDNYDNPGAPTKTSNPTYLPGGVTVNKTTRTVAGTVPLTEGGRTALLFLGSSASGGAASRAILYYNVAPAAQGSLFENQSPTTDDAVSLTVASDDFHSGNLGPHTYTVTKTSGSDDFTITGNGTDTVAITGTAATEGDTVFSIACTNSIGQTTTVTRTISTGATGLSYVDYFDSGTDAPVDGWTNRWDAATWNETSGGYLRVTPSGGRFALAFDQVGDVADFEALVKLRAPSAVTSNLYGGVVFRGSGDGTSETGYRVLMTPGAIQLVRFVDGSATTFPTGSVTWSANVWYWMRVRVSGTTIRARLWADGASEPGTWQINTTDGGISAAGFLGLGCASSHNIDFDQFSYGLGGDPAVP